MGEEGIMMTFLKRQWYIAGYANEVGPAGSLARTIVGEPILFWRDAAGTVSAIADICPHRWAPLSAGKIDDGVVTCGYHGLAFDRAGRCVRNPHGPILDALKVRAYPVVEKHEFIWVWTGEDAAEADPSLIPDLGFIDSSKPTAKFGGYLYTKASHRLLVDNILDLSHADYLHPDTLGGGSITRVRAKVEEEGDTVFISWTFKDEEPWPIFRMLMRNPEAHADLWVSVRWNPNGVMVLRSGGSEYGQPPEATIDTYTAHVMTPETENTCHYFFTVTRNYAVDDADYNAGMAAAITNAFEVEDKPMIEGQQARLGNRDLFEVGPKLLITDSGSTRARRIFERLLAGERAKSESAEPRDLAHV
jgi:vanillate O-demethylase monooxygenase subunit